LLPVISEVLAEIKAMTPSKSLSERQANLRAAFAEHDIPWPKDVTLYWDHAGPKISYGGGLLKMSSLNPETQIQWRMNAREMLRLGWLCIVIAWRIRGRH
jgi:hypothetical protein